MKRMIFCTTMLLFIYSSLCSMNNRSVLVTKQNYTSVFDAPNGCIIDSIRNELDLDRIYSVTIEEINDKWIKIKAYDPLAENIIYHAGWVLKGDVGVYLKDFNNVKIYEQPNIHAKIKKYYTNPEWGPYVIFDLKDEWLLIEYNDDGTSQRGWIPPEYQASNPYTTEN